MSEQFSTEFKTEGQPAFPVANEGDGTPSASSADESSATNGTDDKGTDGKEKGDAGFADHPRWKEREEDWTKRFNDQEVRHQNDLKALREEFGQKKEPPTAPAAAEGEVEVPDWFNGDAEEFKKFEAWNLSLHQKSLAASREQETKAEKERQAKIDEANTWFSEQVKSIEADKDLNPDGEKVDVNKLLKFTMDNDLVDSQGRWNYRAGYRMLMAQNSKGKHEGMEEREERKKLAAATTERGRSESKPSSVTTSADFRDPNKRPW